MAKATGNISQKPVVVKLNKEQIAVLDMVVANGDYNGRSHAIRELLLPALNAGVTAMNTGSGTRAMYTWIKEMKKLTKRMDDVAKNAKNYRTDRDQVELDIGLPPVRIEPLPTWGGSKIVIWTNKNLRLTPINTEVFAKHVMNGI